MGKESKYIKALRQSEYAYIDSKVIGFGFILFEAYGFYMNNPIRKLTAKDYKYLREQNSNRIFLEEAKKEGSSPYRVPKEVARKAYRFHRKYSKLSRERLIKNLPYIIEMDLIAINHTVIKDQREAIKDIYKEFNSLIKKSFMTEDAYVRLASVTCDSDNFAGCCVDCDKCPLTLLTKASLDLKHHEVDPYFIWVFRLAYLLTKTRLPKLEGLTDVNNLLLQLKKLTLKGGEKNE